MLQKSKENTGILFFTDVAGYSSNRCRMPINFNSVSVESGVSQSYFRGRIEMLRKQLQQSPRAVKRQMSDESKYAMIQLLR
ncbi:hypothetical protein [Bacillus sp. DHT2]|uniref:hypothetical protein n=1 Tax=Bacillus sp. DHT2 TaxID=2994532 RepID=UPI002249446F|nr:hypothetical protein [Bacillus sp. DHT2]